MRWLSQVLLRFVPHGRRLPPLAIFLIAFVPAAKPQVATPQSSVETKSPALHPGISIEREISGKQADRYQLSLDKGQFAYLSVDQRSVDVTVELQDADGHLLVLLDSDTRIPGAEHMGVVADSATDYTLVVSPRYSRAEPGKYVIQIAEPRVATDRDRSLFEAHELSRQAQEASDKGKQDQARDLAQHALEEGEKGTDPNDPYIGELVVKLAEFERSRDHTDLSEKLFKRGISLDEAALGRDSPQTAFAMVRLAALYTSMGNYASALSLAEDALAIAETTLGKEHPLVVLCLINTSLVHENLEDYDRAETELHRALAISDKVLEPNDLFRIGILNNLGDVYRFMGDFDRAEAPTEQAIELLEQKYGPDNLRLANSVMNLGIIKREQKQYARSLELLWRAEAIREKALGFKNTQTAASLISLASTYRAEGDYVHAIEMNQRARAICEEAAGPYHYLTLLSYLNLAIAYAAAGQMQEAVDMQAHGESILEKSLSMNLAIGSEREKLTYLKVAKERTDRSITFSTLLAPDNPKATELAALIVLQRKGRVLDAVSGDRAALRARMNPEDQKLLDELDEATSKLAKLALNGPGRSNPEEYAAKLAAADAEQQRLESEISVRSAQFRTQTQTVTLRGVESQIPSRTALIEFASYRPFDPKASSDSQAYGEPHYVAFVFHQEGGVRSKELGPSKTIDTAVERFRNSLRDPNSSNIRDEARELDALILAPLQPLLGDATQLLISPDGELNLLPFEALVDEQQRFVIETASVAYLTTGRDLLRMTVARSRETAPVIIANPSFGEPGPALAPVRSSASVARSRISARRSVTSAADLSSVYFAPLAGTAVEGQTIKSLFPSATLLTGEAANKAALKQVDGPSILHIATHGFFLADPTMKAEAVAAGMRGAQVNASVDNPLLRSGLALAGANLNRSGEEQGVLTSLEASNLNLWGTKLVTLSACDTGVGEIKTGEGVYGLRRSFVLAGAESVVMSLWPVSDYVTRELMSSYYQGLKSGLGRGEALRQTKLMMLKRKGRQHPFYWASFIQSGDWRSLNDSAEMKNTR